MWSLFRAAELAGKSDIEHKHVTFHKMDLSLQK